MGTAHTRRTSVTFDPRFARAGESSTVIVNGLDGSARFTILTPALVRLEWQPHGHAFEDRPSFAVIRRDMPTPEFAVERGTIDSPSMVVITTASLRLAYDPAHEAGSSRFSAGNLTIERSAADADGPSGWPFVWKPGQASEGNLGGTVRTLDGVSGDTPLPGGLLSRDGWSLVDDSHTPVFETVKAYDGHERAWPTARWHMHAEHSCDSCGTVVKDAGAKHAQVGSHHDEAHAEGGAASPIDWYFFGHGRDYAGALADFAKLSGEIPVPPRYALGVWWSRYWAYSDEELKDLVGQFDAHDVPLDVLVIDMDWHLDGWTGYSWNPAYFADPEAFLGWCHDEKLRTTLNLHPADGVGKHERAFHEFAHAMGMNTFHVYRVPFDCADAKFVDLYFELLHHPIEAQGIDFWWMDWQQGTNTSVPGLDPLPWLNHLHWADMEHGPRSSEHRPLVFSRWGGLGNHRYQVGFSGDTYNDWESLAFQPRFTATAGNVGYAWWSHDIGGHQPGPVEPELYVRWIQFGITSPILRTHASKNPEAERRIWAFPEAYFAAARDAFKLRTRLIPYLYSAAHQAHQTTLPLLRPMYLHWPMLDEAYEHADQYLLGESLLCAPVLAPADAETGLASTAVWLPPGEWVHWFTGRVWSGAGQADGRLVCQSQLDVFPMFLRAGGAVALAPAVKRSSDITGQALTLRVARASAGDSVTSTLIEDDTISPAYLRGAIATTSIVVGTSNDGLTMTIDILPAVGEYAGQPAQRVWTIELMGAGEVESVEINGETLACVELASLLDTQVFDSQVSLGAADPQPVGWAVDPGRGVVVMRSRAVGLRDLTKVKVVTKAPVIAERAGEQAAHQGAQPTPALGGLGGVTGESRSESLRHESPNASPRRPKGL